MRARLLKGGVRLVQRPVERQQPGKLPLVGRRRHIGNVQNSVHHPGIAQDARLVLLVAPVIAPSQQRGHAGRIVGGAVNVAGQPLLPQVNRFVAAGIGNGNGDLRAQHAVVFKLDGVPQQGFLQHHRQFPGDFHIARAGGFLVGVGAHASGIESVVFLRHPAPGQLLQDVVKQVGVFVLQPDDERVGEILHIGPADGADGRPHLHRFAIHQHADVLLQSEAPQRRDDRILPHHFLPEHPVGVFHRNVHRIGQLSVGNLADDFLRPLAGQQAPPGEYHPHIADGIFQIVGLLRAGVDGNVFQRFGGGGQAGRAPQHVVGNGVIVPRQPERHGVKIVLRAVNGVVNVRLPPPAHAVHGRCHGLQQHNVVVHRINAFIRIVGQVENAGQLAVRQFHHNGEGAFAVERRPDGNQRRVGDVAAQAAHPRHAQCRLHRQPVVLLHFMHRNGQRPHLVFAHIVKPEMEGKAAGWRLEHQLCNAGFPQPRLQVVVQPQIVHPVRNRYFQNVRWLRPPRRRQFKGQPPPHIGGLHIAGAEQQLARVKRPAGGVANLPVGLDDFRAAGEMGFHQIADALKNGSKETLVSLGKSQRVPVAGEPLHKILGQVGPAHYPQLAEKCQTAVVQTKHRFGPHLAGRAPGGVGGRAFRFQRLRFGQQLRLPLGRQVLENGHPADNPLLRGIVKRAVGALPPPGNGAEPGQNRLKFGDNGRAVQR